jgi:hypothetical protein
VRITVAVNPIHIKYFALPARDRFYHFHGLPCARLDRDQSVYDDSLGRRSYLITILSPILFHAPDVHLYSLEKAYVDKIIYRRVWQEVVQKLNKEWEEFTLLVSRRRGYATQ